MTDLTIEIDSWFIKKEGSHRDVQQWMKKTETVERVKGVLDCSDAYAKHFLGLLYIFREKDAILEETLPLDRVLGRLVSGLVQRIQNQEPPIEWYHAVVRAKSVFNAWKARDKTTLLRFLEDEAVRRGLGHKNPENEEESQEEILNVMQQIGGTDVANIARQRCERVQNSLIRVEDLEQKISETVERAFWDSAYCKVKEGNFEPIYDVLKHVRNCMRALLSAAPTTRNNFEEHFDVEFIEERGKNNALTRHDVGQLAIYLVEQIGRMHAPIDDSVVLPWVESVKKRAEEQDSLQEYLPEIVYVVRDSIFHLRTIYRRITECTNK